MAKDTYEGRLECDGNGNLLASDVRTVGTQTVPLYDADGEPMLDANDEQIMVAVPIVKRGKLHGTPVAWDEDADAFVFVKPGDKSHNERHHGQHVEVVGTQTDDETLPGYAGTKTKLTKGNEHHFGTLEDDAHYDESAPNQTRPRTSPDKIAARESSHTHQHKGGE